MTFQPYKSVPEGSTRAVIGHLYSQAGGAKQVAFILGLQPSRTYQKSEEGSLTLDEAARLTLASGSTAAAEYLATLAGGSFVSHRPAIGTVSILIAESAKEHAEVVAGVLAALDDGEICGRDAAKLCGDIDDAMRRLTAARQKLTAMKEAAK